MTTLHFVEGVQPALLVRPSEPCSDGLHTQPSTAVCKHLEIRAHNPLLRTFAVAACDVLLYACLRVRPCSQLPSSLHPCTTPKQVGNAFGALSTVGDIEDSTAAATAAISNARRVVAPARQLLAGLTPVPRCGRIACHVSGAGRYDNVLGMRIAGSYAGMRLRLSPRPAMLLTSAAFRSESRRGAWGGAVNVFVPLMLDAPHAKRALPAAKHAVRAIYNAMSAPGAAKPACGDVCRWESAEPPHLSAGEVVSVLSALLDGQALDAAAASEQGYWARFREAVGGYCLLHHLFLRLAGSVPGVAEEAGRRLDEFVANPACRGRTTPGAVLALLAVAPRHSLADVLGEVLQEGMLRGFRRALIGPSAETLHGSFWLVGAGTLSHDAATAILQRASPAALMLAPLVLQVAFVDRVARRGGASPSDLLSWCASILCLAAVLGALHGLASLSSTDSR